MTGADDDRPPDAEPVVDGAIGLVREVRELPDARRDAVSHLHLEFAPPHRSADELNHLAGPELAGGAFMSDVAPEEAAARLRDARP